MAQYENIESMKAELAKLLAEKATRDAADQARKDKSHQKQLEALRTKPVKWQVSAAGDRIGAYGVPYLTDDQWVAVLREENTASLRVLLTERGTLEDAE
jgi:hypothetical protein